MALITLGIAAIIEAVMASAASVGTAVGAVALESALVGAETAALVGEAALVGTELAAVGSAEAAVGAGVVASSTLAETALATGAAEIALADGLASALAGEGVVVAGAESAAVAGAESAAVVAESAAATTEGVVGGVEGVSGLVSVQPTVQEVELASSELFAVTHEEVATAMADLGMANASAPGEVGIVAEQIVATRSADMAIALQELPSLGMADVGILSSAYGLAPSFVQAASVLTGGSVGIGTVLGGAVAVDTISDILRVNYVERHELMKSNTASTDEKSLLNVGVHGSDPELNHTLENGFLGINATTEEIASALGTGSATDVFTTKLTDAGWRDVVNTIVDMRNPKITDDYIDEQMKNFPHISNEMWLQLKENGFRESDAQALNRVLPGIKDQLYANAVAGYLMTNLKNDRMSVSERLEYFEAAQIQFATENYEIHELDEYLSQFSPFIKCLKNFSTTNTVAYYDSMLDKYYISIKGTDVTNPHDLFADYRILIGGRLSSTVRYMESHNLVKNLKRLRPNAEIIFIGYSLGGAIAANLADTYTSKAYTFALGSGLRDLVRGMTQVNQYKNARIHNTSNAFDIISLAGRLNSKSYTNHVIAPSSFISWLKLFGHDLAQFIPPLITFKHLENRKKILFDGVNVKYVNGMQTYMAPQEVVQELALYKSGRSHWRQPGKERTTHWIANTPFPLKKKLKSYYD